MKTLEYLRDPQLAGLFMPSIIAGVIIALLCGALSWLVVVKRLAFIGQGVSHAALGGVGVAVAVGAVARAGGELSVMGWLIVCGFCLAAAVVMSRLSQVATRGGVRTQSDTAIGIVLVASMALGVTLLQHGTRTVSWESFLFGSVLDVAWKDCLIASAALLATLATLWWFRRPMTLWAFDATAARSLGVRDGFMSALLMVMLVVATVTSMKLAGVVLATALLVLPGAISLTLGLPLRGVVVVSCLSAVVGVVGGLVASFELDALPGASIVLVLTAMFAVAKAAATLRSN